MYTSKAMAKKSYSVAQARSHLPTILNEVGAGDEIYLTRRGQPAAVVVSTKVYDALRGARGPRPRPEGRRRASRSLARAQGPPVTVIYLLDTSILAAAVSRTPDERVVRHLRRD